MRLGGKLTIGRKGYWIATVVLLVVQGFGPKGLGVALLAPWIMLYLARLRNAGRSALHLLHLAVVVGLILIPAFAAPAALNAYLADAPTGLTTSASDTIVFVACVGGAIVYYLAFSIWLGCIKTRTPVDPATLVDTFS